MKLKCVAGIDPGNLGAIAFLSNKDIKIFDMPIIETIGAKKKKINKKGETVTTSKKSRFLDETEVRKILSTLRPDHVFLEKSQSMPGQGAPATFNYATSYGILRGICVGLQIPYTLIRPNSWKKEIMKDMGKDKKASIIRALQLYPKADIGKKDGRAEALLILHYGLNYLR